MFRARSNDARRSDISGSSGSSSPSGNNSGRFDIIARWIADNVAATGSVASYWDLYETRSYADLWYGARAAGERLRAVALERLYRNRPRPGGPHPDPREPAAFSSQAVLSVAASLLGLHISPLLFNQPPASHVNLGGHGDETSERWFDVDEETGQRLPYAWIVTYPVAEHGGQGGQRRRPPEIGLRSLHASQRMMEHEIACLLGYWHRDYHRLTDPDSPSGSILIPHDPSIETLLHQYAIGLLCLPRDCPTRWHCHCNGIRKRFNAPRRATNNLPAHSLSLNWNTRTSANAPILSRTFPIPTSTPGPTRSSRRALPSPTRRGTGGEVCASQRFIDYQHCRSARRDGER